MEQRRIQPSRTVFTLADVLTVIRKGWALILSICVLTALMMTVYIVTTPKKYTASAQLLAMSTMQTQSDSALDTTTNLNQLSVGANYIKTQIQTYPQLVKTKRVLDPVIAQLGLDMSVKQVAKLVSASNPANTYLVNISATSEDPTFAKKLANAVAESLNTLVSTSMGTTTRNHSPIVLDEVEPASQPQTPSSPKVVLLMALALMLGLGIGLLAALIKQVLNKKITNVESVRSLTDIERLGSVAQDAHLDATVPMIIDQPESSVAEEYRKICTNLSFLSHDSALASDSSDALVDVGIAHTRQPEMDTLDTLATHSSGAATTNNAVIDTGSSSDTGSGSNTGTDSHATTNVISASTEQTARPGRVIVVSSTSPGEGKTTTAVNLATALVEEGKKVLLIDADLRHPSVAQKLGVEGSVGLIHLLSKQASFQSLVQNYWKPTFHVLPAGTSRVNVRILIKSRLMSVLLTRAVEEYDYVLVDTPPMSVSHDAMIVGSMAEGVIMVIGKNICDKRDLTDTLHQFDGATIPVLGYVFNFADYTARNSSYYYYSGSKERSTRTLFGRARRRH